MMYASSTHPLRMSAAEIGARMEIDRLEQEAVAKEDAEWCDRIGRDLDETRRLLYACLVAHRTAKHHLVGTIANALLHHSGVDNSMDEVLNLLIRAVEYPPDDDAVAWVRGRIADLTARLDSAGA